MIQLDEKLLKKSTHSHFLVTMVANSSKITYYSAIRVMNKWLVLEMDGNRKWFFCITWQQPLPCPGKCYQFNYHQLSPIVERVGIFIIWAIPFPHMPKPWAGHIEAKQPVPHGGQGCQWSPRAQEAASASRAAHSIWQDPEYYTSC